MSALTGLGLVALFQVVGGGVVEPGLAAEPTIVPPPAGSPASPTEGAQVDPAPAEEEAVAPVAEPAPTTAPPPTEAAPPPTEDVAPPPAEPLPAAEPPMPVEAPPATLEPVAEKPAADIKLPVHTGRGLLRGAIATGAVGWSMAVVGMAIDSCSSEACVDAFLFATLTRWVANGASLGLAIPAGKLRGQYEAAQYASTGAPARNAQTFINWGTAGVAVGAASWLLLRVGAVVVLSSPRDTCRSADSRCYPGYLAGVQTSFAMAAAGAGALSYGLARKSRESSLSSGLQLRVVPQMSAQYRGLAVGARF